jgi:hypothetical protein
MPSVAESISTLDGMFKQQYPQGVPDLIPGSVKLQKLVKFVGSDLQLGDSYVQPVRLTYPTGFTHAASGSGAFALSDSIPGQTKKATVDGSQILLRDQVDMESAAKAANGSKQAFDSIDNLTMEGLQKSMRKRIECELFYGSYSMGKISAISGSGTSYTFTIDTAHWAPGVWSGIEGCYFDAYSALSSGTKRNSNAVIVLSSVNIDNKTISVTGNSTDLAAVTVGDFLYFYGAYSNEMKGLHYILANTSASLFNITASSYSLWQATSYAISSAPFSFGAVKKATAKAIGKGADEDLTFFLNPSAWDDAMTDVAALRRTDKGEVSKVVIGANEIEFNCQGLKISLVPSIYVKEGFAFGVSEPYIKRVGACDVTFNMPGFGDQIFFTLPSNAGIEARCYTHQALFTEAPAKMVYISGIVNNTSV